MWFELAWDLKMSVQRCMAETTSSEFVDWVEFRRMNMNNPDRADYYMAQVACEVRRSVVKHPNKVKLSDFLLKFTTKHKDEKPTQEEIQRRTQASKAAWFARLKKFGAQIKRSE